jgi:hypothetical protein
MEKAILFFLSLVLLVAVVLPVCGEPRKDTKPDSPITLTGESAMPVVFDGHVSKFEYGDAVRTMFPNGHGTVEAFTKAAGGYLYFAFSIPDRTPHPGDDIVIMLDTKNRRSAALDSSDIRAYVRRKMENSRMEQGNGKAWENLYGDWEYRSSLYSVGWEVEARIPLKSLNLDFKTPATMGLAFRIWDNSPQKVWNYPLRANEDQPRSWGTLIFSKK